MRTMKLGYPWYHWLGGNFTKKILEVRIYVAGDEALYPLDRAPELLTPSNNSGLLITYED